jgi:hypothetical protein
MPCPECNHAAARVQAIQGLLLAHTRLIHCAVEEMHRYRHEPMIETLAIRTAKEGAL